MKKTNVSKIKHMFNMRDTTSHVMRHFFLNPAKEFTVTEVAFRTGLSKATASRAVAELEKRGIVTIEKFGKAYRVRANQTGKAFKREKIAYNLSAIMRSGIIDRLAEKYHEPKVIILFGSFRQGEDEPGSDVDIAVEVPEGGKTGIFEEQEFGEFEKYTERKVAVHAFSRKEININVFENITNGIVLYGFLEVSK